MNRALDRPTQQCHLICRQVSDHTNTPSISQCNSALPGHCGEQRSRVAVGLFGSQGWSGSSRSNAARRNPEMLDVNRCFSVEEAIDDVLRWNQINQPRAA